MRLTIGVAVASDAVRVVAVRDGIIKWAAQAERSVGDALAVEITNLLKGAPLSRWSRPRVIAVIGPAGSQTKRLTGLPPLKDVGALAGVVRESVGRFFLRNGVPVTTSGVRIDEEGAWVAAFERPIVEAIEAGCKARNLRLGFVAPTLVVLSLATPQKKISWRDGEVLAEVSYRGDGRVEAVGRGSENENDAASPPLAPGLAALGSGAWLFADAFGAAVASQAEPIAWRGETARSAGGAFSRNGRIACAAAVIAGASAVLMPSLGDAITARRSNFQLAQLAPRARRAVAARGELARMSRALSEISSFTARRHSPVLLIAALTRALPEASAIASIHLDSIAGTMVVVTPRIASALSALESVRSLAALEIVGPVTKEISNGKEVERASMRFRLSGLPAGAK